MQLANPIRPQRRRIIFLIVLSVIGFTYGVYRLWDFRTFSISAVETQGQIIARDGSKFTIQYNVKGSTYLITEDLPSTKGMSGLKRMKLQPGVTVAVLYDPLSPANAKWAAERNWVFPLVIIFLSLLSGFAVLFPDIVRSAFSLASLTCKNCKHYNQKFDNTIA